MKFKELEFELPEGYVDRKGRKHKFGFMRKSTADDIILIRKNGRYKLDHSYEIITIYKLDIYQRQ